MKIEKKSIIVISFFFIILFSCQPRVTKHGNFFNPNKVQLLKKTNLNKSEVIEIFGEPTIKSTFSDNVWYYITLVQHEKAYFEIKNLENNILAITFNEDHLVKKYKIFTKENLSEINISHPNETFNENEKTTFIQEFFSLFTRSLDAP